MDFRRKVSRVVGLLGLVTLFAFSPDAFAGSRDMKKFGIFGGLLGTPYPSLWGVNAGFNALSFVRVTGGFGSTSVSGTGYTLDATTLGGEAKFLIPNWNFSPSAAFGYSYVSATITGTGADLSSLGGLSGSDGATYMAFGLDWQTNYGLNLGFDVKVPLAAGTSLPGIYLGWYF